MNFVKAKEFLLSKLERELDPTLKYHNTEHTQDVLQSVENLGKMERVNGKDFILLKTAALFHDSGMLIQYDDHEEASTRLASRYLPDFGYTAQEIKVINKMIMSTSLPQNANTELEKILCDADLDYLGRVDFFMIAHRLQYEWNELNIKETNLKTWYKLQIEFLENHNYFTVSAKKLRQKKKEQNIKEIKDLLIDN